MQPFIISSVYICPVLLCLTWLLLFLGFEIFYIRSTSISFIFNCVLLKFTSSVDSREQPEAKGNCFMKSFTCCAMLSCSHQGWWDGQGKCHTQTVEKFTKNFSPKILKGWGCYGDIHVWRNNIGMHIRDIGGPGSSVGIATELRVGRSGIESRWGRDFPPVQTGPGAHPASCKMGTGSFPGVKCGRGMLLTTHPLLVPRPRKSRAIPLPTL